MDHNQWNRNVLEHRIDQWREQRAQKMAARLQLNSTKPRTISSNVLGYVNYRQPMTVQPGFRQQHEGPRFNHVDQRWNPNYNYSGYREHQSPHKQYHGDHRNHGDLRSHGDHRNPADHRNQSDHRNRDHRNHGYGHGSYQQHGQKKGGHFSSHKSLYNDKKYVNKPSKRFSSSCNSINDNTSKIGNQNVAGPLEPTSSIACTSEQSTSSVVCPPEHTSNNVCPSKEISNIVCSSEQTPEIVKEEGIPSCSESSVNIIQGNSDNNENATVVINDLNLLVEQEIEIISEANEMIQESSVPESDRLEDKIVNEVVETLQNENCFPEPQGIVKADVISDISVLDSDTKCSGEESTVFVDTSSTIAINIVNVDDVAEVISDLPVQVNDHESTLESIEPQMTEIGEKELSEDDGVELVAEQVETVPENSAKAFECTDVNNLDIAVNMVEIPAIEQTTSPDINSDVSNETLNLELNLSFKPDIEIVEDTDGAIDPLALNAEETRDIESNQQDNNEGIGESFAGTSFNKNAAIFPVALLVAGDSDTEASIIRYNDVSPESDKDLSKDIELVENKLSNITINNKDDMMSDKECFTPMKRERRQVFLDATNILPSSTIKFAVREVRTNDESEIIVTPVRRSGRLSTLTPVSAHKSLCVQKLEELSPDVIQKMKFVQNPAIDTVPEC